MKSVFCVQAARDKFPAATQSAPIQMMMRPIRCIPALSWRARLAVQLSSQPSYSCCDSCESVTRMSHLTVRTYRVRWPVAQPTVLDPPQAVSVCVCVPLCHAPRVTWRRAQALRTLACHGDACFSLAVALLHLPVGRRVMWRASGQHGKHSGQHRQ